MKQSKCFSSLLTCNNQHLVFVDRISWIPRLPLNGPYLLVNMSLEGTPYYYVYQCVISLITYVITEMERLIRQKKILGYEKMKKTWLKSIYISSPYYLHRQILGWFCQAQPNTLPANEITLATSHGSVQSATFLRPIQ